MSFCEQCGTLLQGEYRICVDCAEQEYARHPEYVTGENMSYHSEEPHDEYGRQDAEMMRLQREALCALAETSTEKRIKLEQMRSSYERWRNMDIPQKIEKIGRHYATHAVLAQSIAKFAYQEEYYPSPDGREILNNLYETLLNSYRHDFGTDPTWNIMT